MTKHEAHKASTDDLLRSYEQVAITWGNGIEGFGGAKVTNATNEAADTLNVIYSEIRARGASAQRDLLGLLNHDHPGVRLSVASHSLEFSPADGVPMLESLIPVGQLLGFTAKLTLEKWRKGE